MGFRTALYLAATVPALALGGCASVGTSTSVSAVARPMTPAPVQSQVAAPAVPALPADADFSTAVAVLANTPGSGVVAVGRTPSTRPEDRVTALALAASPAKPAASAPSRPRAAATPPARPPVPASRPDDLRPVEAAKAEPVACDPVAPVPGCVAPKTVLGDPIIPVRRF